MFRIWWTEIRVISVAHCRILLVIGCKLVCPWNVSIISAEGRFRTHCVAVVLDVVLYGKS